MGMNAHNLFNHYSCLGAELIIFNPASIFNFYLFLCLKKLLNLLRSHWLIKPYRFQVYIICILYCVYGLDLQRFASGNSAMLMVSERAQYFQTDGFLSMGEIFRTEKLVCR